MSARLFVRVETAGFH